MQQKQESLQKDPKKVKRIYYKKFITRTVGPLKYVNKLIIRYNSFVTAFILSEYEPRQICKKKWQQHRDMLLFRIGQSINPSTKSELELLERRFKVGCRADLPTKQLEREYASISKEFMDMINNKLGELKETERKASQLGNITPNLDEYIRDNQLDEDGNPPGDADDEEEEDDSYTSRESELSE